MVLGVGGSRPGTVTEEFFRVLGFRGLRAKFRQPREIQHIPYTLQLDTVNRGATCAAVVFPLSAWGPIFGYLWPVRREARQAERPELRKLCHDASLRLQLPR